MEKMTNTTPRFVWNGIKLNGKLFRATYSIGPYNPRSGIAESTISIRAKNCPISLPDLDDCAVENNTDSQMDHFEKDTLRIPKDSRWYEAASAALNAQYEHRIKIIVKRDRKLLASAAHEPAPTDVDI